MLTGADYDEFRRLVEAQSVRQLRRTFDYGKRARQGAGIRDLHRWVGRILLDRDEVYDLADRAVAFEIGACEWLAGRWDEMAHPAPAVVTVAGPVDKLLLVRLLRAADSAEERAAWAALYAERYGRAWSWIGERADSLAAAPEETDEETPEPSLELFERFLAQLDELDPLPASGDPQAESRLLEAEELIERLRREAAALTDRADRAALRAEGLQDEVGQLRRSVRQEADSGEKLRDERSRRIRAERQARDAAQELERLKAEYIKLDGRLRAGEGRGPGPGAEIAELTRLAQADPLALLGLQPGASAEELAQARRRFAAAFHSDRASQLPPWVGEFFDQLLALVNAACDRAR